jgi:phage FluMu protein Com
MAERSQSFGSGEEERRCVCGSLLARLSESGVELKCRRCKRVVVIPWSAATTWHGVHVEWEQGASAATD